MNTFARNLAIFSCGSLLTGGLFHGAAAFAGEKNATGLPTYPTDPGGTMDKVFRQLPNGQHCMHYASDFPDELATVLAWFKNAMPHAQVKDVNLENMYGGYFKLNGSTFRIGNDFVNVYRLEKSKNTSVEAFKCQDPPSKREN